MSEICNDATRILRVMSCLQQSHWPDFAAQENKEALEKAATDTFRFTKNIIEATKQGNDNCGMERERETDEVEGEKGLKVSRM